MMTEDLPKLIEKSTLWGNVSNTTWNIGDNSTDFTKLGVTDISLSLSSQGSQPGTGQQTPEKVIAVIVLFLIMILSFTGNFLVLYVIGRHLHFKTVTNIFIASLSTSDLCVTCICMTMSLITLLDPGILEDNLTCIINGFANSLFGVVSTCMLVSIAIDRYFILVKVPRTGVTTRLALTIIILTFLCGIVLSFPWSTMTAEAKSSDFFYYKHGFFHCFYTFHINSSATGGVYDILMLSLCYLLPGVIMAYCCLRLWNVVRQTDSRVQPATVHAHHLHFNGEVRTAKTVLFMVLLFLLLRGPYIMTGLLLGIMGQEFTVTVDTITLLLFWSNCATNPILYAVRNPNFSKILNKSPPVSFDPNNSNHFKENNGTHRRVSDVVLSKPETANWSNEEMQGENGTISPQGIDNFARFDSRSDSLPSIFLFLGTRKGSTMSSITNATTTTTV